MKKILLLLLIAFPISTFASWCDELSSKINSINTEIQTLSNQANSCSNLFNNGGQEGDKTYLGNICYETETRKLFQIVNDDARYLPDLKKQLGECLMEEEDNAYFTKVAKDKADAESKKIEDQKSKEDLQKTIEGLKTTVAMLQKNSQTTSASANCKGQGGYLKEDGVCVCYEWSTLNLNTMQCVDSSLPWDKIVVRLTEVSSYEAKKTETNKSRLQRLRERIKNKKKSP